MIKIFLSKNMKSINNAQVKCLFEPNHNFRFGFISDSSPIFEILTKHSRNPNWKPGRRVPRLVTSSFFVPCIFIGRNAILRPMKTCLPSRFHLAPKPKFQPRHLYKGRLVSRHVISTSEARPCIPISLHQANPTRCRRRPPRPSRRRTSPPSRAAPTPA